MGVVMQHYFLLFPAHAIEEVEYYSNWGVCRLARRSRGSPLAGGVVPHAAAGVLRPQRLSLLQLAAAVSQTRSTSCVQPRPAW